jgi:dipeptidyl aminopeptidase/acylaminoacyl peptidase
MLWLTWNHPNMPWDGTELWVADVAPDGTLSNQQQVAGGLKESIYDPQWSPDGRVYFVSDRTGWWNLYRLHDGQYEALHEMEAEFGRPQWAFGSSTYSFESPGRILCVYVQAGVSHLATLDTRTLDFQGIDTRFSEIVGPKAREGQAYFVGAGPTEPWSIVRFDLATGDAEVLRRSNDFEIDPGYLSLPQSIEFPTEGGLTAHGIFYPPKNKDYRPREGEKPPLLVMIHGGPTSATSTELDPSIQFWTSRGIAVLDVNYGGSTGYGRPYRERLNGQWGVVDVDDCVNGAKYLAARGLVDSDRMAIRGGSAGGYTTLLALTQRDAFKAGASYYGVSDLTVFVADTHKFESRYLDSLVGPYPESDEIYKQRSALNYISGLSCPVIFFQGLDDKVVPPNQAELMVNVLREKGLPVAYVAFEGEGHGFRQSDNIKRSLENELYFYSRVFGFQPGEQLQEVEIENM